MLAVNYSTVRENLKSYCDKAVDDYETVIVTRKGENNVVLLSLAKYNALLKAARNAEYLDMIRNAEYLDMIDRSMEQIAQGKTVVKTMDELEAMAE